MARGGHELPKVSLGLAMPEPSTRCRRATPETALRFAPYALRLTPYALRLTPYALRLTPYALRPFRGDPPASWAACGCVLPLWARRAVRL
jgi:hypothetical protein